MRYFLGLFCLMMSLFTIGQRITTPFTTTFFTDEFSFVSKNWQQTSSSSEALVTSGDQYHMRRMDPQYFTIAMCQKSLNLDAFEISAQIKVAKNKANKRASGGLVVYGQPSGNEALIVEINNKGEYRFRVLQNGRMRVVFQEQNMGWIYANGLKKKKWNELKLRCEKGIVDVYINDIFQRSFIQGSALKPGNIGLFVGANSALDVERVEIKTTRNQATASEENNADEDPKDDTFQDLILIFKTKIDKQQKEINQLREDLDICQASLGMDTTLQKNLQDQQQENDELKLKVRELEANVAKTEREMEYLKTLKENIEQGDNGDLILELTMKLTEERKSNKALEDKVNDLNGVIKELKALIEE